MSTVDSAAFIVPGGSPNCGWPRFVKRSLDIAAGLAAVAMFAPVMLILALFIKLTSRGPVLYRQARIGLLGRPFEMLKFRSMRPDAESQTGPVWASRDDTRCTTIGRFMRRWSLDELPQLFNVLAGDMSLVGPRPERGVFVEQFRREIPNYPERHQVKPGMTGWAQINGWRGDTSLKPRVECDLHYVRCWSLWLDFKILLLTPFYGFRHANAH